MERLKPTYPQLAIGVAAAALLTRALYRKWESLHTPSGAGVFSGGWQPLDQLPEDHPLVVPVHVEAEPETETTVATIVHQSQKVEYISSGPRLAAYILFGMVGEQEFSHLDPKTSPRPSQK